MEPIVNEQKSPSLQPLTRLDMIEINNKPLDLLFTKVNLWFEATVGLLLSRRVRSKRWQGEFDHLFG